MGCNSFKQNRSDDFLAYVVSVISKSAEYAATMKSLRVRMPEMMSDKEKFLATRRKERADVRTPIVDTLVLRLLYYFPIEVVREFSLTTILPRKCHLSVSLSLAIYFYLCMHTCVYESCGLQEEVAECTFKPELAASMTQRYVKKMGRSAANPEVSVDNQNSDCRIKSMGLSIKGFRVRVPLQ